MKDQFGLCVLISLLAVVFSKNVETNVVKVDDGVLVNGITEQFAHLTSPARIVIKCNKTKASVGRLFASVNGQDAVTVVCVQGSGAVSMNDTDDKDCLTKFFLFDLNKLPEDTSYYVARCVIESSNETEDEDSVVLKRLYGDSFPRIRFGLYVNKPTFAATYHVKDTVSCEAISDSADKKFDSIQWFKNTDVLTEGYSLKPQKTPITNTKTNFSSTFLLTAELANNPSGFYKCCTTFKEELVACTFVRLLGVPSTTTTSTTTTTTKTTTTRPTTTRRYTTIANNASTKSYTIILLITLLLLITDLNQYY